MEGLDLDEDVKKDPIMNDKEDEIEDDENVAPVVPFSSPKVSKGEQTVLNCFQV